MSDTMIPQTRLLDSNKQLQWMYENGFFSLTAADMIADEMEKGTFDADPSNQGEDTRLREALAFYADPATYDIGHLDKHGYIIIDRDGGQRAREALISTGGSENDG